MKTNRTRLLLGKCLLVSVLMYVPLGSAGTQEAGQARAKSGRPRAFSGEIYDSQCAQMGSHDQMMKGENAKDAKDCSLKCLNMGGKLVLYNKTAKAIYQLDDQDKAKQYAGQKVTVKGTYERSSKTIHVTSIEAIS